MVDEGEAQKDSQEIPFNIANLRAHLQRVATAQRALPDDLMNRQKLLEMSVYDIAQERLKYENEKLEDAIGHAPKLLSPHLQNWMYEWHEKLQRRLEAEIPEIVEEEKAKGRKHSLPSFSKRRAHLSIRRMAGIEQKSTLGTLFVSLATVKAISHHHS